VEQIDHRENQAEMNEIVLRKNTTSVEMSEHVSLDAFVQEDSGDFTSAENESHVYKLKSMIYHQGKDCGAGHYIADAIRLKPHDGAVAPSSGSAGRTEWVCFDDSTTCVTTLNNILSDEERKKTAYLLLYLL